METEPLEAVPEGLVEVALELLRHVQPKQLWEKEGRVNVSFGRAMPRWLKHPDSFHKAEQLTGAVK